MNEPLLDRRTIVPFIGEIFERRGADSYLGEAVTMAQHMLQCAQLAERAGADDALIAAALLHDIGHYTGEFPEHQALMLDNRHDQTGAAVLAPFFPKRVVVCVRHHVAAKRYLCAVDPAYFDLLSEASRQTLRHQGGPMRPEEAEAFAQLPDLAAILQVRRWDEAAKDPAVVTPSFDHYRPLLERVVDGLET